MKTTKTIFQDGNHKWVAIVRDPEKPNFLIDTNEYLVTHGGQGLLLDPGGAEIFPAVFSALSAEFDPLRGAVTDTRPVTTSASPWLVEPVCTPELTE